MGIDVIVNRRAHHLKVDNPVLRALQDATRGRGTLHETWSLDELEAAVAKIAARGTRAVVLAGGDGAYMAGVTALTRALGADMPNIALAPGGTVSTVARNWGFAGAMAPYAGNLVRAVADGAVRKTPIATLRVRDDAEGDRVGFIFGAGLVASFFDAYYAGSSLGYGAAAGIVARLFAGSFVGSSLARKVLTPVAADLTIDGEIQTPRAWSLIATSVVRNLGLHMHLTHRAGEDPERMHVVASPLGPRALGPQMPLVLAGRRLLGRTHVDTLARSLAITFADPVAGSYVLDGELIRARKVTVAPGPALSLLTRA